MSFAKPDPEKQRVSEIEEREDRDATYGTTNLSADEQKKLRRSYLWKIDIRILPAFAALFLLSFIDRTNIGNAKVLGLQEDLGLSQHEYQIALAVYYLFYIVVELPSNLVLKKISPKIWLPAITVAWGICCMGIGFTRNFAGLTIARTFLGITEGGLLPGIVLHLNTLYTRQEIAIRMGLIYASASASGAFAGLLARGLYAIGATSDVMDAGWRWIFVMGILTVIIGCLTYFLIPNDIKSSKFLTPEERSYALLRMPRQNESFAWSEVFRGFMSLQLWLSSTAYFAILCALYSYGLFLPSIIVSIGTFGPVEAQLYSVPPYVVACVATVAWAYLSDYLRLRGGLMLVSLPLAIVGYAVIANIGDGHPHVKYGMTFLISTGLYMSVPCILVWLAGNSAGHYKRATVSALQLMIANCGGFVATFLYPASERPNYSQSHNILLGLICYAWLAIAANSLYCRYKNKQKDAGKFDRFIGCGDDREPDFKMTL